MRHIKGKQQMILLFILLIMLITTTMSVAAILEKRTEILEVVRGHITLRVHGEDVGVEEGIAPFIHEGVTYVPLRFVSETLGYEVSWSPKTSTIDIFRDYGSPDTEDDGAIGSVSGYESMVQEKGVYSDFELTGSLFDKDLHLQVTPKAGQLEITIGLLHVDNFEGLTGNIFIEGVVEGTVQIKTIINGSLEGVQNYKQGTPVPIQIEKREGYTLVELQIQGTGLGGEVGVNLNQLTLQGVILGE